MKKEKIWIGLIALVLLLSLGASYLINQQHQEEKIATISLKGKVVKTIDLEKVEKPYTFKLDTGEGHYNTIAVNKGNISIIEADCPDQLCVHQGKITDGLKPIVCLPHELVIRINGEVLADAQTHQHEETEATVDTIVQ